MPHSLHVGSVCYDGDGHWDKQKDAITDVPRVFGLCLSLPLSLSLCTVDALDWQAEHCPSLMPMDGANKAILNIDTVDLR